MDVFFGFCCLIALAILAYLVGCLIVKPAKKSYYNAFERSDDLKKSTSVEPLPENSTVALLARRTALFYGVVGRHPHCKDLTTEEKLTLSMYLDMLPYLPDEIQCGDFMAVARSVELSKNGFVRVAGFEKCHSFKAVTDIDLICNVALQTQVLKHFIDNNYTPSVTTKMVLHFKQQILDIVKNTLELGVHHYQYKAVHKKAVDYLDNINFCSLSVFYNSFCGAMSPSDVDGTKLLSLVCGAETLPAHEPAPSAEPDPEPEPDLEPAPPANPVQDPGPSADDILAEMGKVEPAPPAPAQPTSIDISNLTDEQKALVAQLVDSMKK